MPWSQPELLFHEILHLKEALVGYFHFGAEKGGTVKKRDSFVVQWLLILID